MLLDVFGSGTRVTAVVRVPKMHLVGLSAADLKFDRFVDDKGTDLQGPDEKKRIRANIRTSEHKIAPGGDAAAVQFHVPVWPAEGATKILVKGSIVATIGKDAKTVVKEDVLLGVPIDLGGGVLSPPTKEGFGGSNWTYRGDKPLKSITLSKDDAPLPFRQLRSSVTAKQTYSSSFLFDQRPIRATVRAEYFDAVEAVELPIEFETGLGLKAK